MASSPKVGPSIEQWRIHKDVIVDLYKQHTLKEVRAIMSHQYSFQATKRMYDRKLKTWGVQKNMSRARKAEIVSHLVSTGTWADSTKPSLKRRHSMDARDHAKVVRYAKSQASATHRREHHQTSQRVSSPERNTSNSAIFHQSWSMSPPQPSSPCLSRDTARSVQDSEMDAFDNQGYVEDLAYRQIDQDFSDMKHGLMLSSGDIGRRQSKNISVLLSPSFGPHRSSSFDMERVINNIHDFCAAVSRKATLKDARLKMSGGKPTSTFWTDLSHGIYLLKVDSPSRAWPAINKACDLAARVLQSKEAFDITFLLELLSTLSPVNTRKCPELRTALLQYLSFLAQPALKQKHPLAIICHELQKDLNHDREVSERALWCLRESVTSSQTIEPVMNEIAFRSECALIALLRRASDLDAATDRAQALVHRTQSQYQYRTVPTETSSIDTALSTSNQVKLKQARSAATQLAHIYMDRHSHLDEAIDHCFFSITGILNYASTHGHAIPPNVTDTDTSVIIQDSKSVHAMEDLAKIYGELLGDPKHARLWLEQAAAIAPDILGPAQTTMATQHIFDKLRAVAEVQEVPKIIEDEGEIG